MKAYRELSRRGRLRRLRKLAETALVAYGLDNARLNFIQYAENCVYRVDLPAPDPPTDRDIPYLPNRYLLRIHALGDI